MGEYVRVCVRDGANQNRDPSYASFSGRLSRLVLSEHNVVGRDDDDDGCFVFSFLVLLLCPVLYSTIKQTPSCVPLCWDPHR